MKDVKVGDILAGSWGYSMVLWEFVRVEKVTEKQVVLQPLKNDSQGGEMWHEKVLPGQPEDHPQMGALIRVKNDLDKDYIWLPKKRCLLYQYDPNKEYFENHMD